MFDFADSRPSADSAMAASQAGELTFISRKPAERTLNPDGMLREKRPRGCKGLKEDCMGFRRHVPRRVTEKTAHRWIAFTLVVGTGVGAAGCRSAVAETKARAEEPITEVETTTVTERAVPHFLTLTGTLVANQKADVAADVSGRVQRTFVERGSFVTPGSALASVDARSASLSQREASAQVRALEAQSSLAQSDCERAEKLFRDGTLSKAEYERQGAQCQATQWSKEAATARAHMAGKVLGDSTIRAPFAGIVAERFVTAGEYVRPDTRVITLVDIDKLRLELTVQESAVAIVQEGQTVSFRVASFADLEFPAKIQYVGPALRRSSRDLVVEAILDNADRKLRPGMFATAKIELGTNPAPVVPRSALRDDGTTRHLFVVNRNRLEERVVEIGDPSGDEVAIVRGVVAGDQVVKNAAAEIKDGLRVK
ncbi:MAG TPA: efflux RND transporter periplasmic adaptor subunit [Polyangiaceae bacterium]